MELHIIDRIYIPMILPKENSFMDFNLKRDIIKKVEITEADIEKYEIKENQKERRTEWNITTDRDNPLVVDFTPQELAYMKTACEKTADKPAPDNLWATVEKIYTAAQATV